MLILCQDKDDLAAHCADLVIQAAREAIEARGRFLFVLAGGSTPEATYKLLAQPDRLHQIDWPRTFIFMGDERLVPPDDPRSNFGMAEGALLSHVPLPAGNVFPMVTSWDTADEAANAYSGELATFFQRPPSDPPPAFDLILLGMGDDGHTASLFPGMPSLEAVEKWVVGSPPGTLPPPVDRITFTYPILNAARRVAFLVSGAKKADAVQDVLENHPLPKKRPSAGVQPLNGELLWLVDEAAAGLMTHNNAP